MITILTYAVVINGLVTTNRIELDSFSECLKEKDRIEMYYSSEYANTNYSIETSCKAYQ
jgi:hypothetical protein